MLFSFCIPVSAANEELYEYEGYGKKMHEAVVEDLTYLTTNYYDNKDYVSNTMTSIKDYANFLYDEAAAIGESNSIHELFSGLGGAALTVGDYFKKLLVGYGNKYEVNNGVDLSYLKVTNGSLYVSCTYNGTCAPRQGYAVIIEGQRFNTGQTFSIRHSGQIQGSLAKGDLLAQYTLYINNILVKPSKKFQHYNADYAIKLTDIFRENYNFDAAHLFWLFRGDVDVQIISVSGGSVYPVMPFNDDFKNIYNYYVTESIGENAQDKTIPLPVLVPSLKCGDEKINLTYKEQVFKDTKGNIVDVNKTGTTEYEGVDCDLSWLKSDKTDEDSGEDSDGDSGGDCDGVLCFLSKIIGAITGLAAEIVKGILNGLESVFKFLFVPPDNFWSENIAELEEALFGDQIDDLLARTEELKNVGGSNKIASLDIGGAGSAPTSNSFQDVVVSLMGVDDLVIIDSGIINSVLDNIHDWVRGVFYALLVLFNVNQLYKLIRGTSLLTTGRNVSDRKDGA